MGLQLGGHLGGLLEGRRALITGVASQRSIAWGIAQALHAAGAELAFTYQNEKLRTRVEQLAAGTGSELVFPLDVTAEGQIEALFDRLAGAWDRLDVLVHSMAYAPREALEGSFVAGCTREAWRVAQEVSAYSLVALARAALPLMAAREGEQGRDAALLTLSYLGAERVVPNYNVMGPAKAALESAVRYLAADLGPRGIRVNAISAGPIRTLAASGIGDFRRMLEHTAANAPLRRNVTIEDVGGAAAFLCSPLAAGVTGEVLYVDAGYHIMGLTAAPAG
ncbi:MAG: enoyl-ACP reductase [Gammaproteobacteria bacterium]|nr:MAG: enoyl-ACP reductase [Gammaproteobacteria bacterium]